MRYFMLQLAGDGPVIIQKSTDKTRNLRAQLRNTKLRQWAGLIIQKSTDKTRNFELRALLFSIDKGDRQVG